MHRHCAHHYEESENLKLAFWLNFGFAILELIGGFLSNSVAIMSDALHDLGDSLAILLALILAKSSTHGRTDKFSYGWKRFSLLGAFFNALILIGGSVFILFESFKRMSSPEPVDSLMMICFAILGLAVNTWAVLRVRKGKTLNSQVISLHLLEDVLGWAVILVGSIVIYFTEFYWLDAGLAIVVALFILWNAFGALKKVGQLFLQSVPSNVDLPKVIKKLKALPAVKSLHDVHVWSLDGEKNVGTIHLVLVDKIKKMEELNAIKVSVRALLKSENIDHVTIEIENSTEDCHLKDC